MLTKTPSSGQPTQDAQRGYGDNQQQQSYSGQQYPHDPNNPQQQGHHDPNAPPFDPNAPPYDPNAPFDPNNPNGPAEGERGLGTSLLGGAAGYYMGHRKGHGFLGALGGAVAGNFLGDKFKDRKHHGRREQEGGSSWGGGY